MLGNGNKRQLQIVELAESFSNQSSEEKIKNCKTYCNDNSKTNENCNCNGKKAIGIIETKKTSLVYYDTTKEKKLKYIKTFELETKTQIDSNDNLGTSTISGYSFLSLDTKYNTYKSNIDGYENKLATVIVRTYNGYDAEDRTYDIKMYSNSTYSKDSQLAGTVFKIKVIDDGDLTKTSPSTFYLKYDVGYYKDLDGDEIDSLDNVSSKTGYTLIRYDDSNGHEVIDKSGNFLSKIAFDNTNTSKKEGEIRPVWSANTYVVSFNPGKGTLDGGFNKDVVYDGTYGDLPTASRLGYSFDGWYTSETGGSKVSSDTKVKITAAQTLYAHLKQNKILYSTLSIYCANYTKESSPYMVYYSGNCSVHDDGNDDWRIKFLTSGELKLSIKTKIGAFLVGGGEVGGGKWGGGGDSGYTKTFNGLTLDSNKTYKVTIDSGGSGGSNTDYPNSWTGSDGESSTIVIDNKTYEAKGGLAGGLGNTSAGCASGGSGGSGIVIIRNAR